MAEQTNEVLQKLATVTKDTEYYGKLFLAGGIVRDNLLGRESSDIDIVMEGDCLPLVELINKELGEHSVVSYPKFGTAMITIDGLKVEFVTARKESYSSGSRKPEVEPTSLENDAFRRDFTINALFRNLHTGEVVDYTGRGELDLNNRILDTPLDPEITFEEDPLRMLRAIRFSNALGFDLSDRVYTAIFNLRTLLKKISRERIRDEFFKMVDVGISTRCMVMLLGTGMLKEVFPRMTLSGRAIENMLWVSKQPYPDKKMNRLIFLAATYAEATFIPDFALSKEEERIMTMISYAYSRMLPRYAKTDSVDSIARNIFCYYGYYAFYGVYLHRIISRPSNLKIKVDEIEQKLKSLVADYPERELTFNPLDGNEIIEISGLPAGEYIGKLKSVIRSAVIDGTIPMGDVDAARKFLKEFVNSATFSSEFLRRAGYR